VGRQIVGVELAHVHGRGAGGGDGGDLLGQPVGTPCGKYHDGAPSQARRQFDTDFATAAKYHHQARVIHGCDYVLR
jgi:hypothetical protein